MVILVAGVVAGAASFALAYHDAQDLQDDDLRQLAALLQRPSSSGEIEGDPVKDPETRVIIAWLPSGRRPSWLPADLSPGLHTLDAPGEEWRVYVADSSMGGRVAVAQSTVARDEIAIYGALHTLVPIVLMLPLLVWLTARTVRSHLSPLRALADVVDQQPPGQPQPITVTGLPEEIVPFAHAINRLLERVARLMDAQRRFVADAAHELRSPLTALSLQAQNVEQAPSLDAARTRITALRAGIDRARRVAEQLLSLAHNQTVALRPQCVHVAALVRELLAEQLPLTDARGIDLGVGQSDEMLQLSTDPALLATVLRNGLDNAVRYTPVGGEVTVRYVIDGSDVVIEVADSGPGVPEAQRERAFAPFSRLKASTGTGSGLGLAIARSAATRMGATIDLDERVGGGLVFRYRQPQTEVVAEEAALRNRVSA